MQEQNYSNHSKLVPGFHGVTLPAIFALVVGSFVNLFNSSAGNLYSASLICLTSLILVSIFFYCRSFALRVQDRAIRAEETSRYFVLTNKVPDSRLTMSQIIALRFASDQELPELAQKAADENMSSKEVKQRIKKWRPDYHRA